MPTSSNSANYFSMNAWFTLAQANGPATPGNPAMSASPGAPQPATPGAPSTTSPGTPTAPPGPAPAPGGGSMLTLFLPFIIVIVLMMIFSSRSQRKERNKRAELLASISKHDKVQTIGGIIGTVVELRDDEIILKVDENSNTRIRFARSAVQQVLKSTGNGGGGGGGGGGEPSIEVRTGGQGARL